jgi:hypothetical protein
MAGPYTNIHSSRESYQRTQTEETFSFSSSTPPALPRHNVSETNQDALLSQQTLHEIPVRSSTTTPPPNYPYTQSNTTLVQDPMSEMKFMDHYDSDDDMEKQRAIPPYKDIQQRPYIPLERKKKRSCIDKMCCGCCTCCPKWLRWCTCFIFIIILCICIVIGVLAALFKVPEVSFTDPASPVVSHPSTTAINISSSIGITVQNPNIEGLTFSTIKADVSHFIYVSLCIVY